MLDLNLLRYLEFKFLSVKTFIAMILKMKLTECFMVLDSMRCLMNKKRMFEKVMCNF